MAKDARQLNQKQVDVLQWVIDGCPEGVFEGYDHRIVARALANRGLITVAGHGAAWTATPTGAGRAWLTHPPKEILPMAEEAPDLIERVIAAGGKLTIPVDDGVTNATYSRLVRMSKDAPNRPRGKRLVGRGIDRGDRGPRTIYFVDHYEDLVEPSPVAVPGRVGRYHPAVKAFLADRHGQFVTAEHVPRAARILEAIVRECDHRGWKVAPDVLDPRDPYVDARSVSRHLAIQAPVGKYTVEVREISARGAKKLPLRRDYGRPDTVPGWVRRRGYEFISTGRLELRISGPRRYDWRLADAKSTTVEDRLSQLFQGIDIAKLEQEAHEEAQRQDEADRERRRQAAFEAAKERFTADYRWRHFQASAQAWREIGQQRQFLAEVRAAVELTDGDHGGDLGAYLDEMEQVLAARDPIQNPELLIPPRHEPTADDLQPYLQRVWPGR